MTLFVHAVCDGHGRSQIMLLSEGQMSDHSTEGQFLDPAGQPLFQERPAVVGRR